MALVGARCAQIAAFAEPQATSWEVALPGGADATISHPIVALKLSSLSYVW
ncbi:MAG: hypothetical protein HC805_04435 [Alkalinema sp. RL_2_19]|nr:hypothetical protein [Alkalinema sp. RL_2_19]